MRMAGAAIARRPAPAAGTVAFIAVFGVVGANALWYQAGAHPAPLVSTRDRLVHMAKAEPGAAKAQAQSLTIGEVLASASPKQARALPEAPDTAPTGSIPAHPDAMAQADPLIRDIQKALAERQFYSGPLDGLDGDKTRAAIEAFQAATASHLTGEPSKPLLAEIEATHGNAVAIARSHPGTEAKAGDDVIASIASLPQSVAVPAPRPDGAGGPAPATAPSGALNRVARIQTGLRNIAYSNVDVDGILGEETRAAIRNFEKNYRLPVTGEPDERVLKKLIDIGAL